MAKRSEQDAKTEISSTRRSKLRNSISRAWTGVQSSITPYLPILFLTICCYLPAFLLVFLSFLLFKPVSTPNQIIDAGTSTNQSLTKEQKEQIKKEVRQLLSQQSNQRTQSNLPYLERYIENQVELETKEQAEKAAKDKVDELKADWKGDLFGQTAFPVVFAIASIFAAFAVKDILTEVLKEQEKERVKQELTQDLENQIVPKAVESSQREFNDHLNDHLEEIESYTYWLEYQLLTIEMNQVLNEIKETSATGLKEQEECILLAVKHFFNRANAALDNASVGFRERERELIRKCDYEILKAKIDVLNLSEDVEKQIERLSDKSQDSEDREEGFKLKPENQFARMESLFHMQMRLFIITLHKLQDNEHAFYRSDLIREVEEVISIDWVRRSESRKNRMKEEQKKDSLKPTIIE